MTDRARYFGVDALRGVAAISVLAFHYLSSNTPYGTSLAWAEILQHGVEVFFVISGFVIGMSLERSPTILHFAASRFTRLYPTYWACVFISWSFVNLIGLPGRETDVRDLIGNLTMAVPILNATLLRGSEPLRSVDAVYWSLTCELLFYILAAAMIGMLGKRRAFVGHCAWLVTSILLLHMPSDSLFVRGARVLLNAHWAPYFFTGIVLHRQLSKALSLPSALTIIVLVALATAMTLSASAAYVLVFSAAAVFWGAHRFSSPPPALIWLGAISYPLYLTHQNIGYAVLMRMHAAGVPSLAAWALTTCLALGIAWWVYAVLEKPLQRTARATLDRLLNPTPGR